MSLKRRIEALEKSRPSAPPGTLVGLALLRGLLRLPDGPPAGGTNAVGLAWIKELLSLEGARDAGARR